jgi:hypothetical protein
MMHAEREVNGDCFACKIQSLMRRAPPALGFYQFKSSPATKSPLILTNCRTIPYQNPALSPSSGQNCAVRRTLLIRS